MATTRMPPASSRATNRCASAVSNREASSPARLQGPGCSTSSRRLAGKALPIIGSPRRVAATEQRSNRSAESVTGSGTVGGRAGRHHDALAEQPAGYDELLLRIQVGQDLRREGLAGQRDQ